MSNIIVVDDHPFVSDAIRLAVSASFQDYSVISAASACEMRGLLDVGNTAPMLAIVDLNLPDADGVDLVAELHAGYQVPVIVLSGRADGLTIDACVNNGASGFVEKSSKSDAFVTAIKVVLSGGQYFPSDYVRSEQRHDAAINTLTDRQREILDQVIAARPNKMIADTLNLAEGTVKNHVSHLLSIFGVTTRQELFLQAQKVGYRPRKSPLFGA